MKLEQIFYGRNDTGYGILGASVPRCGLTDSVQDICSSIGTPGAEYADDDKPILIQKRIGDTTVMVCCRTGAVDSLGRGTLFFHALAADAKTLDERKLSAADFFKENLFACEYPGGEIRPLEIDVRSARSPETSGSIQVPAIVRCKRSENIAVLSLLGARAYSTNWATFSWRPLLGFDFYGLDQSVGIGQIPSDVHVYNAKGEEMRRDNTYKEETTYTPDTRNKRSYGLFPLILGLLLGACLGWFANSFHVGTDVATRTDIPMDVRPKIPTFPADRRITDFDAQINSMPRIVRDKLTGEYGTFLVDLKNYVDFVNTNTVFKAKENAL